MSQNYNWPASSSVTLTGTPNNAPIPSTSLLVAGENNLGNQTVFQMDSSGNLKVALSSDPTELAVNLNQVGGVAVSLGQTVAASSIPVAIASDQSAIPASQSGTWNINNISGTISLPTGAATSANQTTELSYLSNLNSTIATVASTTPLKALLIGLNASGVIDPLSFGQGSMAGSVPVAIASDQSAIPVTQSGTWTTRIATTGGSSINLGQATAANSLPVVLASNQGALTVNLQDGLGSPVDKGQTTMSGSLPVAIASNQSAIPVSQSGTWALAGTAIANTPIQNVYSSTNVTTSAYVQLVASTTSTINKIHIFDSSGQAMILGIGGSGSEIATLFVPPGGDTYTLNIPAGSRLAYRAITGTANTGYLLMSFLG